MLKDDWRNSERGKNAERDGLSILENLRVKSRGKAVLICLGMKDSAGRIHEQGDIDMLRGSCKGDGKS